MTNVLIRRRKFGHRGRHGQKTMRQQRQRLESCVYKPQMVGNHQKDPLREPSERAWLLPHLDFRVLVSKTVRK